MRRYASQRVRLVVLASLALAMHVPLGRLCADTEQQAVSFSQDILPIFQTNCHGCHQPAKAEGDYLMTSFDGLLMGGESGAAVAAGDSSASYLMQRITPVDGVAEMPPEKPALSATQLELIQRWIDQGAEDDSPAEESVLPDAANPPRYDSAPVVTALDVSPDGSWLAIAGFHEVLLCDTKSHELQGRLIGLSQRIQSLKFSPDGKLLAVAGGTPVVAGEVQIWNVAEQSLQLSFPVTYDTVYGASWSPDNRLLAFGCADNSVRVIDVESGEQVLYQASHNDWVLDTIFSTDGSYLVSAGRDQTAKLILVKEERFVDNITSITPGALKGGISSIDRHPAKDQILIGGADGSPQILRMNRIVDRQIGDNANLIKRYAPVPGRIFATSYSPSGNRIAVASTLDGKSQVTIYTADFDDTVSEELKRILAKRVAGRDTEEKKQVEAYQTEGVELLGQAAIDSSLYALAYLSEEQLAVSGTGGVIRILDASTGSVIDEFMPFPVDPPGDDSSKGGPARSAVSFGSATNGTASAADAEATATVDLSRLKRLSVVPSSVQLSRDFEYAQLVVTAQMADGALLDVTRQIQFDTTSNVFAVGENGAVVPLSSGEDVLRVELGAAQVDVAVQVDLQEDAVDYIRDVTPVLSRLGCNAGTCHGAKDGKNGFKLSLRGYDPIYDVRALTDDLSSRRVNLAAADESLMLAKATGRVPHTGGQLTTHNHPYYHIMRRWIEGGVKLNRNSRKVEAIALSPQDPTIARPGQSQQFRVVASYADGSRRDVTAEAFITSGNTEVAESESGGLLQALRRGEAPVLARYEGAYDATLVTVMGDRSGFEWQEVPAFNLIDALVYEKLKRIKAKPSALCTDAEFLRRVSLDLTGLPPTVEQVQAFLDDTNPTKEKRAAVIDQLIGSEEYIDQWTNKWADLLHVNRKFLGVEGAAAFWGWIREQVAENVPYDEFVRQILTVSGSNKEHPQAGYYKSLRAPADVMENTTHLFLAVRFNCNKCHDHPFERWTQDQYYELAAFFARLKLSKDEASGDTVIGGTAVESPKPLYEIVADADQGEMKHERTGQDTAPEFPYTCDYEDSATGRREKLAAWITSADNQYFAKSYVNRLWGYLLSVGIIEPIDDIRAGNPPSNPELLNALTERFIASDFNVREMLKLICNSRTYQLSSRTNEWNEDDRVNYSHALPRRLPAEVLYDALHLATGAKSQIPEMAGKRAAQIPDSGLKLPSGFLDQLGRPARESACECERVNTMQLGPVMAMISGPTVNSALHDENNAFASLVAHESDDGALIRQLYLRILNRPATDAEVEATTIVFREVMSEHAALEDELAAAETEFAPAIAEATRQRLMAIDEAEQALTKYQPEADARTKKLKAEKAAKIVSAKQELDEFAGSWEQEHLAQFEQEISEMTQWSAVAFDQMESTNKCQLEQSDDLSVLASGPNGKTTYKLKAAAPGHRLTGIRLEALTHPSLKQEGPGRSDTGNFVVGEFKAWAVSNYDPAQRAEIKLKNPQADFSQDGYGVKEAIDGKIKDNKNGWAIEGGVGTKQHAVFETQRATMLEPSQHLEFEIVQPFQDEKHSLGRFRILVTSERQPLGLAGITSKIAKAVGTPRELRSEAQTNLLRRFARKQNEEWNGLFTAHKAATSMPIAEDAKLVELTASLTRAKLPIRIPSRLIRLREEIKLSRAQAQQPRLTAAQDLAWALINSPAFLFNH